MDIRHVLLTTDLSEESERSFDAALSVAKKWGARITLLHVVLELQVTPHGAPFAPPITDPEAEAALGPAREKLEEYRTRLTDGVEVATEVVMAPDVAKGICGWAEHHDADVIVMSTHGLSGFRRLILGSVTEEVLRCSDVPVLCVPRKE